MIQRMFLLLTSHSKIKQINLGDHLSNKTEQSLFPSVMIVIVNYNQGKKLTPLLSSLLHSDYPNFQILLVDNNSVDNSKSIIESFNDPRLKTLYFHKNVGLCKARNMAARTAKVEYLTFIDPDIVVTPSWLKNLVKQIESDSDIGIVESKIISDVAWGASSSNGALKLYALGASFIIRQRVWAQLGGFDDEFFIGYDDQDFGWKTWLFGYRIVGSIDSIVYHYPGSLRKGALNRFIRYHDFKNRLISLIKNLELTSLIQQLPRIIFLELDFMFDDVGLNSHDGLKANFWILTNFSIIIKKRLFIQYNRKISDKNLLALWDPSVRGSLRKKGKSLW
jgi:GT2 family glycosyltransferase